MFGLVDGLKALLLKSEVALCLTKIRMALIENIGFHTPSVLEESNFSAYIESLAPSNFEIIERELPVLAKIAAQPGGCEAIIEAGGIEPLLEIFKSYAGAQRDVRAYAVLALAHISLVVTEPVSFPSSEDLAEQFLRVLTGGDSQAQKIILEGLVSLTLSEAGCAICLADDSIEDVLSGLERSGDVEVRATVLKIKLHLLESDAVRAAIMAAGELEMFKSLLTAADPEISSRASRRFLNIVDSDAGRALVIAEPDLTGLGLLALHIDSSDSQVRDQARRVLAAIVSDPTLNITESFNGIGGAFRDCMDESFAVQRCIQALSFLFSTTSAAGEHPAELFHNALAVHLTEMVSNMAAASEIVSQEHPEVCAILGLLSSLELGAPCLKIIGDLLAKLSEPAAHTVVAPLMAVLGQSPVAVSVTSLAAESV